MSLSNIISFGSLFVAIVSACFAYYSNNISSNNNRISQRSNHLSRLSIESSTSQAKNEMAMQAIKEFDKRVISQIHDNLSINDGVDILSYINRWSPYVNDKIANSDIILNTLEPYLLYISSSFRQLIINSYYNKYEHISGFIKMMNYYFPDYKQNLHLRNGHNG